MKKYQLDFTNVFAKNLKRLCSVLLAVVMCVTSLTAYASTADEAATVSAYAGEKWLASDDSSKLGDVDGSGTIDVGDVLYLQLYLAGARPLSKLGKQRADADLDQTVDSADATVIQRWLAEIGGGYYLNMTVEKAKAAYYNDSVRKPILDAIKNFKRAKGVDISEHNGDVDMNKLKEQGYSFVIIRLGFGDDETDQDDVWFERNVKKAEAAGLDWGAYIYSYAMKPGEAKSEVRHTLRCLKGKKPTMPIAFDWETDSYKERLGMPSDAETLKIARTYMDGIRAAGYYPIIYTGYSWLKGAFNDSGFLDANDIWLAQWSTKYDYHDRPIGMWQYGGETNFIESPKIKGLHGSFDKNYSYKNYPVIIKAYGYNNHKAILPSTAATGAPADDGVEPQSENLPPECNGVMGDSLRGQTK